MARWRNGIASVQYSIYLCREPVGRRVPSSSLGRVGSFVKSLVFCHFPRATVNDSDLNTYCPNPFNLLRLFHIHSKSPLIQACEVRNLF